MWSSRSTFHPPPPGLGCWDRLGLPRPPACSGFSQQETLIVDGGQERSVICSEPVLQWLLPSDQGHSTRDGNSPQPHKALGQHGGAIPEASFIFITDLKSPT